MMVIELRPPELLLASMKTDPWLVLNFAIVDLAAFGSKTYPIQIIVVIHVVPYFVCQLHRYIN